MWIFHICRELRFRFVATRYDLPRENSNS